jgi:Tfp pilus assembly protein PilE
VHDFIAGSVVVYKRQEGGSKVGLIVGIVIAVIIPVLAIIGILSSVVLVSLSSARDKGRDAAVKSALMSARAGMEVYFAENNNTYSVARDCASGVFANNTVKSALSNIPFQKLICYAEKDTYAISAELSTRGDSFCVDTTGYSGEGTATDTNGKASCQGEGVSVAAAQISNNQVQTQTQTTSTWNAKVVGGQLSEKDKAEIIAGTMKMVAVVTSGDVATFRKYAAVFAPPEQIQQLEKASDEQLLQLMKMIGPIMAAEVTPEILTSSAAVWTVKDATHVEIKVQKDKNSSQTTRAVKVDGVWY